MVRNFVIHQDFNPQSSVANSLDELGESLNLFGCWICIWQERRAREAIEANPYDVDAWNSLCHEAQVRTLDSLCLYHFIGEYFAQRTLS